MINSSPFKCRPHRLTLCGLFFLWSSCASLFGQDDSTVTKFKIRSGSDSICSCDSIRYEIEGDAAIEVLLKDKVSGQHLQLPYVIRLYFSGGQNLLRCVSGTGPRALIEKLPRGIYDVEVIVPGFNKKSGIYVTLGSAVFVPVNLKRK